MARCPAGASPEPRAATGNEASKPQRLAADVVPDQIFAGVRVVAFVEEQVDDLEH